MFSEKKIWKNHQNADTPKIPSAGDPAPSYFGYRQLPPDEKARNVARHFDSIARRYDFMNTLLSFGIHYLWKQAAVRMLSPKTGERILDVCGGTGDLSILAQRAVGPTGQVVLYDINRAMMQAGRIKATHAVARRRIQYVQGNAEAISFPEQHFRRNHGRLRHPQCLSDGKRIRGNAPRAQTRWPSDVPGILKTNRALFPLAL